MQLSSNQNLFCKRNGSPPAPLRFRFHWGRGLACFVAVFALTGAAQTTQQNPNQTPMRPVLQPEANRLPDANDQMQMRDQQTKNQSFESANEARRKQISQESDQLLTLAIALKAEVDKTNKDTLSLNVIRKADEIEKLAHNVKEKMKLIEGAG